MSAKFSVHSNEHKTYSGLQPSVTLETIIYVHLRDNQFITAVSNHFREKVSCPVSFVKMYLYDSSAVVITQAIINSSSTFNEHFFFL